MPLQPIIAAPVMIGVARGQASMTANAFMFPITKRAAAIGRVLTYEANQLKTELVNKSPRATGTLRSRWVVIAAFRLTPAPGVIVDVRVSNTAPKSYFRIIGRAPGKQPPIKAIQQWCKVKGIDVNAAYPIAKAIGQKGTMRWRQEQNVLLFMPSNQNYRADNPVQRMIERIYRKIQ